MRDEIVGNFYNIYDAVFPTVNILDLTDGIYKDSQTSYEQAQSNQLNWLLDRINCGKRSVVLDIGCGYGTLLEEARNRKAYAEGISISEKHVEFCLGLLKR
jgi:cyclopropane-fatty-acyl-phospholipid synthase